MSLYMLKTRPLDLDPSIDHTFAVNAKGEYIGDEERAKFLCDSLGIAPEKASPDHVVCSIGFSEREQKWFGWSHRAIAGFAPGHTVRRGDCGYVPVDMEDAVAEALRFWADEHREDIKAEASTDPDGRPCIEISWTYAQSAPNAAIRGLRGGTTAYPPAAWGHGEWTAQTLDDAKQMAIDFAEGVS